MRDLPHVSFRLPLNIKVEDVEYYIYETWSEFAGSVIEPFVFASDLHIIYNFICEWARMMYHHFLNNKNGHNEYFIQNSFPDFTVNASLQII